MTGLLTLRRRAPDLVRSDSATASGPVLLVTLEVPFSSEAASVAVDAAVEAGQALVVVDLVEVPLGPYSTLLGYGDLSDDELERSLRAPAELAHSLGVRVELLRVRTPRPVPALLELVAERAPALVVLGPEPARVRRRPYRRAARALVARTTCLVWLAEDHAR